MRVVILGPPASGKGTQARRLAERYGVAHVSTGELLREEVERGTATGRAVEGRLARGELVDDETVCALLADRLAGTGGRWVLDGFPRTLSQARTLDQRLDEPVDAVVALDVPEDELVRRVRRRAGHEGREDDSEETLHRRLAVYAERTRPLLAYYDERGVVHHVDGGRDPDEVTEEVVAELDRL